MPLGLVERKRQSKVNNDVSKDNVSEDDISPEQGSDLYKETEITKTFEHDEFLEEVLRQKQSPKSQGKRIAIIGEPGAGKTTLLQHIADWVLSEIKQAIVIWVSLADLQGQTLEDYLYKIWLTTVARKTGKARAIEQYKDDFATQFRQERVWLLLDGLDEMSVSSGNPATEIARQICEAGSISQARIVLTCRVNLWDGSRNELDDFDIYRTLDFSYPDQVEMFIDRWFSAIPEEGREQGQRLCTALKETSKKRIQDLVKNPLRLTLLCLNWQSREGKLSDTQAELYQQFVDDFYKWKKAEFAINNHQRQQLNLKLGELAKAAIDKETTRFRLRQDFVSDFLGDADDENSLLKLALNHGWLNCVGIDTNRKPVYAFFHISFQEYFAAKAIDDWHFFLNHVRKNPKKGTYRIFEPQWKQTILLWLGRPEENLKQQKQEFITALVNFEDGIGKWNEHYDKGFYEYRAYFLAAAGIAEFRDSSRADEIVAKIVKWVFGDAHLIGEEAKSVLQQTDRTKAITALVQLLQSNHLNNSTFIQVASSLGRIDPGNEIAISALVELLPSNGLYIEYGLYRTVAESLGEIGIGNEIAIAALVQLLLSITELEPPDYNSEWRYQGCTPQLYYEACRQAAASLGQISRGNKNAIAGLAQLLLSNDVHWHTRRLAAESLKKIVIGNENLIANLVELLLSDYTERDRDSRRLAAESLEKIGAGNENATISALEKLLLSDYTYQNTRTLAAESLEEIGVGNENATISALEKLLLSTTVSDYTLWQVAESLWKIDPGNEIVIPALKKLLQSTTVHDDTRRRAAESLWKIDPGNKISIPVLVQLLQSSNVRDFIRVDAAHNLWEIDPGNEIAIPTLMQLLLSTNVSHADRWRAADSLSRIDPRNEIVISGLVQILLSLLNDTNALNYHYERVAKSLIKIGVGNENAIAALVQWLLLKDKNAPHGHYQVAYNWATYVLEQIDTDKETAIAALVQLLQSNDVHENNRKQTAYILGEIGTGNENAIATLVQLLLSTDVDDLTRKLAAYSLGKIGTGNENVIAALVQLLLSTDVDDLTREMAAESLGEIGTGNKNAIAALAQLLLSNNMDYLRRKLAAYSLGKIGTGNKNAIAALAQLLLSNDVDKYTPRPTEEILGGITIGSEDESRFLIQGQYGIDSVTGGTRKQAIESLGEIGTGNENAIAALVQLLQSTNLPDNIRWQANESLIKILQDNKHRFAVVKTLRVSGNYDCYGVFWECAQNMPYPDFYQAWHHPKFAIERQRLIYFELIYWLLLSALAPIFITLSIAMIGAWAVVVAIVGAVVGFLSGPKVWAFLVGCLMNFFLLVSVLKGWWDFSYWYLAWAVGILVGLGVAKAVGVIPIRVSGKYLTNTDGEDWSTARLLLLLPIGLGTSLGIGYIVGFFNPYILLALAGTGLPLATILLYLPIKRRRLIAQYRKSEERLIKP